MTEMVLGGRRAFLRSACKHCLGMGALLPGLPAFAQGVAAVDSAGMPLPAERFSRPALETDEGGLWGMMDREETRLRRSPFVVRDAELGKYLQDLVCRLAGDHCPDIRVHVVRTPLFNATMAPNGMMQIWTGLLLRVENEAQLAAVLGHEIGHYLERHTLERLRDLRSRAAFAQFIGMFGLVGAIGQLGALAGAFAFSRDHETRADRLGMRLMKRAGYDGRQAAQVWDNLLGELKITGGEDVGKRSPMMATHPPVETRRDELLKLAGDAPGSTGAEQYQQAVSRFRLGWLQDEIRRGQFEESLVLFNRFLSRNAQDTQALYARGEVYRLRAGQQDLQFSLDDLTRSTALDQAPAEAFRALGLVQKQRTDGPAAVRAFEKYLAVAPEAADAGLIKNYIAELTP
jgi:beta-barrel assembly-enhancing protease